MPKARDAKESVISIAGRRSKLRLRIRPPCHSNWKTRPGAMRKGKIAVTELLVGDLSEGVLVTTAVTCVNDDVTKILVVLVTPRDDN